MYCLGIESTAHTFGVGIVDDRGKTLANVKHSHTTTSGGMIPRELERHHQQFSPQVLQEAFKVSGLNWKDIDVVSFAKGPGMGPALRVGAFTARLVSKLNHKPLLGVNHGVAHIEIGKIETNMKDPIIVYASGGNTQIIGRESGKYRVYGETLDMGVGNLLDSLGRELGLGFPAGPKLDAQYSVGKNLIELPYSVKGMDLVFSGLLTAATRKIGTVNSNDLVYSVLHTAFAELTEVTERALCHTEKKEVLIVGGVAASQTLKGMMNQMVQDQGATLGVPSLSVCVDNGLMIAWQGMLQFKAGEKQLITDTKINPKWRVDQVKVTWV
jgi:glycoprotease/Kae1 family metallohydrolase